ncbi:MAG: ATP synthase subunit I [Bacteroidota bacterium]
MKFDLAFPRKIVVLLFFIGLLSVYPLYRIGDGEVTAGFIAGGLIGFLNVLAGYFSIEYAFDKSNVTFLKVILGGMGVRLFLIAAAVVILIKVFHFHLYSLTVSLFFFYFLFVILEILFVNKKLSVKKNL